MSCRILRHRKDSECLAMDVHCELLFSTNLQFSKNLIVHKSPLILDFLDPSTFELSSRLYG